MVEWDCLYAHTAVLVDRLTDSSVHSMKPHRVFEPIAEQCHLLFEQWLKLGRGIDVKWSRAAHKTESAYQPNEAKAMVAMQMGDEDGLDTSELYARSAQLQLRPFATIEHKHLTPNLYHLA